MGLTRHRPGWPRMPTSDVRKLAMVAHADPAHVWHGRGPVSDCDRARWPSTGHCPLCGHTAEIRLLSFHFTHSAQWLFEWGQVFWIVPNLCSLGKAHALLHQSIDAWQLLCDDWMLSENENYQARLR